MTKATEALSQLTASVNALNASVLGETTILKDVKLGLFSFKPLTNSIGNIVGRLSNLINPIERFTEAIEKNDEVQRKSLAIGTTLAKVYEKNAQSIDSLRGSFSDNVSEFVEAFSEGIRVNSRSLNVLRDRMQETGQSTAKLNTISKTLITATAGNEEAISRLADTNVKIAKESLISNEKLIDALQRNEDKIDTAALVGLGEGQVDELSKITGLMSERGISDKLQQQVVDLLFSTDSNIMSLRASFGVGMDANEKILNGQMDSKDVLNIIARNAEKTFVTQDKLNRTSLALQGTQGGELLQAAILTNRLLEQSAKGKDIMSKEDAYYAQMKTFTEEQKNFAEQQTAKHYELMKELPTILGTIKTAVLTYLGGKFLLGAIDGFSNAVKAFKVTRAIDFKGTQLGLSPTEMTESLGRALKNTKLIDPVTGQAGIGVSQGIKGADLLKNVTSIFSSIKPGLSKILSGPIISSVTSLFRLLGVGIFRFVSFLLGPVGIAIGALVTGFTLLSDWLGWFKDNRTPAEKAFDELIESVNASSKAIDDNVKKIGKSSETATADSFKFVTHGALEQARKNSTNVKATPDIQPPAQTKSTTTQVVDQAISPGLAYATNASFMPTEEMQKIAYGRVLPTTEELNKTTTGGYLDLSLRDELNKIKETMLEEQQVLGWAAKIKKSSDPGMTVAQGSRTEQGWEERVSSGKTRSQIMDDIIRKNRQTDDLLNEYDPDDWTGRSNLDNQKYAKSLGMLDSTPEEIRKAFPDLNKPSSNLRDAVSQPIGVSSQIQISNRKAASDGLDPTKIDLKEQIGSASKILKDQLVFASQKLRSAPEQSETIGITEKLTKIQELTNNLSDQNNNELEQRHLVLTGIFNDVNEKLQKVEDSGAVTSEIMKEIKDKGLKVIPPKEENQPEQKRSLESVLLNYLSKAANQKVSNDDNKAIQDLAARVADLRQSIDLSSDTSRSAYVGRGGRR